MAKCGVSGENKALRKSLRTGGTDSHAEPKDLPEEKGSVRGQPMSCKGVKCGVRRINILEKSRRAEFAFGPPKKYKGGIL